jgi:hypothetical protein
MAFNLRDEDGRRPFGEHRLPDGSPDVAVFLHTPVKPFGFPEAASDLEGKPQSGRGGFKVPEIAEVFRNAQELLGPIDDGLVVDANVNGTIGANGNEEAMGFTSGRAIGEPRDRQKDASIVASVVSVVELGFLR